MAAWSLLTNHARTIVCIAHDPSVRLRDIAITLGITERSAFGIVTDLTAAGYVIKDKDGRRNRYRIQAQVPLREHIGRQHTLGELLALFVPPEAHGMPRRRFGAS
jgi:Mn-dependent DtxR family transcriptional regulator